MSRLSASRDKVHQNLFILFSALVIITLPFSIQLNAFSIILLSLNWILEGNWKNKYKLLIQNRLALLFVGLYVLHIIGLFHSENIHQGFFELEKRVAFVIFPVIFLTTSDLNRSVVIRLLNCFVATCFIAAIICLANGFYYYFQGDSSYLFYHKLGSAVNFNHAVYFSFYIGFSIFILLTFLASKWESMLTAAKILYILLISFFLIFLILLSSKTIIPTVFLLLIFFIGRMILYKKRKSVPVSVLLFCVTFLTLIAFTVPNLRDRFREVLINEYDQTNPLFLDDYQYYHFTGGTIRLAIWKMTIEIINQENAWLWGVGTGDAQDILTATYIKKHVYPGDEAMGTQGFLHYNTHNQFMQFFLMFGFIGLSFFVYTLIFTISQAIKYSNSLLLLLLILFISFSITESTLHVQKGIVFFSFFTSLLYNANMKTDKNLVTTDPGTQV